MNQLSLHKLSYGLYVLSTVEDEIPFGCIINTAFQITSTPPRIAVSCNRDNFTHDKIITSNVFGISVLSENVDSSLIGTFGYQSGRDIEKFEALEYESAKETGVPLLTDQAMTVFECKVMDQLFVGTHTIFIGEVLDGKITKPDEKEMTYRYYHDVLKGSAPKNAPTYIEESQDTILEDEATLWKCSVCGYIYDSSQGEGNNPTGTEFEDLPEDWKCPICGVNKSMFNKQE